MTRNIRRQHTLLQIARHVGHVQARRPWWNGFCVDRGVVRKERGAVDVRCVLAVDGAVSRWAADLEPVVAGVEDEVAVVDWVLVAAVYAGVVEAYVAAEERVLYVGG